MACLLAKLTIGNGEKAKKACLLAIWRNCYRIWQSVFIDSIWHFSKGFVSFCAVPSFGNLMKWQEGSPSLPSRHCQISIWQEGTPSRHFDLLAKVDVCSLWNFRQKCQILAFSKIFSPTLRSLAILEYFPRFSFTLMEIEKKRGNLVTP